MHMLIKRTGKSMARRARFFTVIAYLTWAITISFSIQIIDARAAQPLPPIQASLTWFATEDFLLQLDDDSHQIVASQPQSETRALTVDSKDRSLLALTEKRILKFSSDGVNLWSKLLADFELAEGEFLAANPYDSSFWVASGNRLIHLDSDGNKLTGFSAPWRIHFMAIALDESLWLLGENSVWHFSSNGTLLASRDLSGLFKNHATHLAIDPFGMRVWIASKDQLAQFRLTDLANPLFKGLLPAPIEELTIDPLSGTLWLVSKTKLFAYANNGTLSRNIELASLSIEKPESIAYDSQKKNLWLAHKMGITKVSRDGTLLVSIPLNKKVKVIGVPAFLATPKLTLIQPSEAAVINNTKPTISLNLDSVCFGMSCDIAPAQYRSYEVIANLNSQPIGNLFRIDSNTGQASYTPSTALPEGRNSFNAYARDQFGHVSNLIDTTFTIDAAGLKIQDVSPSEGSVLVGSQSIVSGTFRGPANTGITVNGIVAAISDDKFYANVPLQAGTNFITVTAAAPDGSTATRTLSITNSQAASFRIGAAPVEGVAPLEVAFSIEENSFGKTLNYILADYDGNGTVDQEIYAPNLTTKYSYATPGIYVAKFEITDIQGNYDLVEVLVVVKNPAEMDKQFQSIWDGMNTALIARDKPKALAYLNSSARVKYDPVFSALLPSFPSIVASYSRLKNVSVTSAAGEYAVNRVIDGVNHIFFIYFLRDPDGVWRLDSM